MQVTNSKFKPNSRQVKQIILATYLALLIIVIGFVYFQKDDRAGASTDSPTVVPQANGGANPIQLRAAIKDFEARISANPNDPGTLMKLGQLYDQLSLSLSTQGDQENTKATVLKAVDRYQSVAKLEPNNPLAFYSAGQDLYRLTNLGDPTHLEQARADLAQATKLAPDNAMYHLIYGMLLSTSPDPKLDQAKQEWQTTVRLDPDGLNGKTAAGRLNATKP